MDIRVMKKMGKNLVVILKMSATTKLHLLSSASSSIFQSSLQPLQCALDGNLRGVFKEMDCLDVPSLYERRVQD